MHVHHEYKPTALITSTHVHEDVLARMTWIQALLCSSVANHKYTSANHEKTHRQPQIQSGNLN